MKYSYFPGCSLKGLGRAYEESLLPVMKHLGVELQELDDWNCCGATAYMAVDEAKACVLAARNLALAEKQGDRPIMAPCAACYLVLNKTKHYFHDYPAMKETIDRALGAVGLRYSGDTPVRHPLDVLINDVGLEAIKQKVRKPLKGLKVATYYGCQLVRPYATFDDQYNPTTMDRLLEALGRHRRPLPAQDQVLRRQPDRHGARSRASAWSISSSTKPRSAARIASRRSARCASSTWTPITPR